MADAVLSSEAGGFSEADATVEEATLEDVSWPDTSLLLVTNA